jgi:hypothetical protein
MKNKLLLLLFLGTIPALAAAAESNTRSNCHQLMTEAECSEHLDRLATLTQGEALEHYLDEFTRTKREREAACACSHSLAPRKTWQRQALLRY